VIWPLKVSFFNLQPELPKQLQVIADDILESFASQHQVQLRLVIHTLKNCNQLVVSQIH
jgi:hypothetical protein